MAGSGLVCSCWSTRPSQERALLGVGDAPPQQDQAREPDEHRHGWPGTASGAEVISMRGGLQCVAPRRAPCG